DIMEKVSKQNLQVFFKQWLFTPGQPELQGYWKYDAKAKSLEITITQKQDFVFQFPLEIAISNGKQTLFKTIDFNERHLKSIIPLDFTPHSISLDPAVNLLFNGSI